MRVHIKDLNNLTRNSKTGPIVVTVTEESSCPIDCPLKDSGCYAAVGHVGMHWRKVSKGERGGDWSELIKTIKRLPAGMIWRHNIAGDLPGDGVSIDGELLGSLVRANSGKRGFTYTHYKPVGENLNIIESSNKLGFTVNLSANNVSEAVSYFNNHKAPVVTVLPSSAPNLQIVDGVKIVACPAEKTDKIKCINCGLCAIPDRDYVIGFRAHGAQKKKAELIALQNVA